MEKNRSPLFREKLRRGAALALCACFLAALAPLSTARATGPDSIAPSTVKVYVKLAADAEVFTTPSYSAGTVVPAGTVLQLVADQTYTLEGAQYYRVYYNNQPHQVRAADVDGHKLDATGLTDYIKNTLWRAGSFAALKRELKLTGDVRVHGLQMALQILGYYSGNLDGNFGEGTHSAVKAFQRAHKLEVDGSAGPITQALLYPLALAGGTGTTGGSTSTSTTGTLRTSASVNLRKSTSTSSARLAVVPNKTSLTYIDTRGSGGVTWYQVVYNGIRGWLMGTFVNAGGSSSGSSGSSSTIQIGTVTITQPGTRVRKTPDGTKTGTVLALGNVVPMLADKVQAGGYGWYKIQTSSGIIGYVRDDCATGSLSGGSAGVVPSSTKTYVKVSNYLVLFTSKEKSTEGEVSVPDGTVLQMVSPTPYTSGGVEYCSLYYQNKAHNALYSDVKNLVLTTEALTTYLTGTIWTGGYAYALKLESNLVGDVRVHAAQLALSVLGYYTGALDGNYGSGSASATRNFQRKYNLKVDGSIGPDTWNKLFPAALAAYNGTTPGTSSGEFGIVKSVEKASWNYGDNGAALFPKDTVATVMDVATKKVFTIYRWAGGNHADCVPYSTADTKVMCDIVGFTYNSARPSNIDAIKNGTSIWPDFKNGGVGSKWDRRPAWLNVNGRVFCVSIYGWPHGYGDASFNQAKFNVGANKGSYFHNANNYYGMMCIHFVGSKTHTGSVEDPEHQTSINTAYTEAKKIWPTLVK